MKTALCGASRAAILIALASLAWTGSASAQQAGGSAPVDENEVEAVVAMHPGVLECACIGVPDTNAGEAVKLFVVRKDPSLTVDELMQYCRQQLTGYKRPKYIEFRDNLPKTNVGKILRRELREEKKVAQGA